VRRSRLLPLAAILALAGSVLLCLFAVDLLRWKRALAVQDVRFLASPGAARYTEPDGLLPFDVAKRTLGGDDDLAFRRQLQGFVRVRPGAENDFSHQFQQLRGATQLGLAQLSRDDPAPERRSRAANMGGVIALDPQYVPQDPAEYANVLTGAIGSFRNAAEIDPANSDAKLNLEQALRIPQPATLAGDAPSGTRDVGNLAGLGRPGTGY
jgi:hypothetical protein